jgi:DNA-binding LacI/PurR family transcriptional regulator
MSSTLKDVAQHANVSIKTVSNVVNGHLGRVSRETENRVRGSLATLNYRPNVAARYLRQGRVGVLALVVPDVSNPYFASLSTEIIDAAAEYGYTVLIDHTGGDWMQESLALRGIRPHVIDGVILSPLALGGEDFSLEQSSTPVVLLGERLLEAPYDHVVIDNVAAAREATAHLLALGRQHIAAVGVKPDGRDETFVMRLRGYEEALLHAGRPVDRDLIAPLWPPHLHYHSGDGLRAMRGLLANGCRPDAVFCMNDILALGVMKAIHMSGMRIPDDIAVVGFDDIEEGLFTWPSLTTVAPDKRRIAQAAVSLLVQRLAGGRSGSHELVRPPYRLVVRASTSGREPRALMSMQRSGRV